MSNEQVAIPRGLKTQQQSVRELRALIDRYVKGRQLFKEAISRGDDATVQQLLPTFDSVLDETYLKFEQLLMLQEYLSTGKAVVIPRDGTQPYRIENEEQLKEMIALSPYELQSVRAMSDTFGTDAINFIDFDRLK